MQMSKFGHFSLLPVFLPIVYYHILIHLLAFTAWVGNWKIVLSFPHIPTSHFRAVSHSHEAEVVGLLPIGFPRESWGQWEFPI